MLPRYDVFKTLVIKKLRKNKISDSIIFRNWNSQKFCVLKGKRLLDFVAFLTVCVKCLRKSFKSFIVSSVNAFCYLNTHFYRIRDGEGVVRPLPHRSFENGGDNIGKLYIVGTGIYWRLGFYLNIRKIFQFRN